MPRLGVALLRALLLTLLLVVAAQAAEVRVFHPREEGLNPSEQRQKTLELGFEEGVFQAALKLLPAPLSEERSALLREHLAPDAARYVLGYKEVAITPAADGLNMVVNVDVDRRTLRETLVKMGLFRTLNSPVQANIIAEPSLTQQDLETLGKLRVLTGVSPSAAPYPELRIGREASGPVRGVLHSTVGSWSALDTDIRTVWFRLWERYFASSDMGVTGGHSEVLSVAGWFTPDGAAEFDNVLRSWDGVLRDVRLIDMDIATEGVSARWEIGVADGASLNAKLEEYLPPRGLSYRLSGGEAQAPKP
ncbi:hypothetical protein [Paucidesulfovibrio longus]|uniref:hypothetical protein n=1 Tax=Paucidesulfovibrio longus TaxID=889 RepID=UPI0003B443AD|nr:hypothetical protein [Paucidesulfovibrio longus]